jgi:hypothetical protein
MQRSYEIEKLALVSIGGFRGYPPKVVIFLSFHVDLRK